MTEQEIVNYLKENKNKGIAFAFMPKEVQDWINDASRKIVYLIFKSGLWEDLPIEATANEEDVFALPDSYELPVAKVKGEWVEFEIDQRGNFHCFKDDDMHYFFWANWNIFLKAFSDEYTAFGGWQYPNCGAWYMNPKILLSDAIDTHYADVLFQGEQAECKPAIPVKIRFWRKQ